EDNRYTLVRRLERDGHRRVLQAASGGEALALLDREPVDLVLLDIMMPEIDGFEVLRRMRADTKLRDIPVIVISAVEELDSVEASLLRKQLHDRQAGYLRRIEQERQRADRLLHAILPAEAVRELKASDGVKPRRFDDVAILFCDLVGFTPYCDATPPEQVVRE